MGRLNRWLVLLWFPAALALSGLAAVRPSCPGAWTGMFLGYTAALLVLFRPKLEDPDAALGRWPVVLSHGVGLIVLGLAAAFHSPWLAWTGVLLCLYGSLRGLLAARFFGDIPAALMLLFLSRPIMVPGWAQFDSLCAGHSAHMAARILQWFDVRAWADASVIHRYAQDCPIPEGAGGASMILMAAVVTVAAGLSIRAAWYELAVALAGVAVLSLVHNAVRMALVVGLGPASDPGTGYGAVLLLTSLVSAGLLVRWRLLRVRLSTLRKGMEKGTLERPDRGTILNGFWLGFVRWWKPAVLMGLLSAAVVWIIQADNPHRRAMLMTEVIDGLISRDAATAARACDAALVLAPDDAQLLLRRAHILTALGDPVTGAQVLARVDPIAWGTRGLVLHGLHRLMSGQAAAFVAELERMPQDIRTTPAIAALRLQLDLAAGNIPAAAAALPDAARSPHIRSLLPGLIPTLLLHQQRQAVIEFGRRTVPASVPEAVAQILAEMDAGDMRGALDNLARQRDRWPGDPNLAACTAIMAYTQQSDTQDKAYEEDVRAGLNRYDADALWHAIEDGFLLCRPDLAWMAYQRLNEVDATDPGLQLAPALYGRSWFVFRKRRVGQVSTDGRETVGLSLAECRRRGWVSIPLADEIAGHFSAPEAQAYARRAVQGFEKQQAGGVRLSPRSWHGYVTGCLLLDDRAGARRVLVQAVRACREQASFFRLWQLRLLWDSGDHAGVVAGAQEWTESGDWMPWQARAIHVNALMMLRQPDRASAVLVCAQRDIPGIASLAALSSLFDVANRGADEATRPVPPAAEWTIAAGTEADVETQKKLVAALPDSQRAWRQWVRVSGGQTRVLEEATRRFPLDDALWLAGLVVKVRSGAGEKACMEWLLASQSEPAFSGMAWASAGDFLRRSGAETVARLAAEEAVRRAPQLLAARNLAIRMSLQAGDLDRAAFHVRVALEQAPASRSLSELLASLYLAGARLDAAALEKVRAFDEGPAGDPVWTIAAGRAALESGNGMEQMERLRTRFEQTRNATIGLLYAEVVQRNDKRTEAVAVLRSLKQALPDDVAILNNLCHLLACADETLPEARAYIPELVRTGGHLPAVLETAALVAYRGGDYATAMAYLRQGLAQAGTSGTGPAVRMDLTPYESDWKKSSAVQDSAEAERLVVCDLVRQLKTRLESRGHP